MKKTINYFAALLTLALIAAGGCLFAQEPDPAAVAMEANKVKTESLTALKAFSWKMRSELSQNEESQVVVLNQLRFDNEGKLQVTNISTESNIQKKKRLKGRKQKSALEDAGKFLEKTVNLALSYVFMTKGELVDYFEKAAISNGENNTIVVRAKDIRVQHDGLEMILDNETYVEKAINFTSEVDGSPISGEVVFKTMEDGPNYAANMVITIPEKNVKIVSENFDYLKQQPTN